MWSHDVISTSIGLAGDLKMGQYLKVPPRVMFLTQVWGTLLGMSHQTLSQLLADKPHSGAIINYGEWSQILLPTRLAS